MNKWNVFLRAINVGGRNVKMGELKALFGGMGFSAVETFIASGNVIFEAKTPQPAALEDKIEKCLREALGYEVAAFARTVPEVEAIAQRASRFREMTRWKVEALNVGFLKGPLGREKGKILKGLETEIDAFATGGRELYWLCRKMQSESKCSNALLERKLGVKMTLRGAGTVMRLAEKLKG